MGMPKSKRRSEAIWMENQQRWQIKVQKDNQRRSFYSTNPSKRGKVEAEKKADAWLESGAEDIHFHVAWERFLAHSKEHTGTSNYIKHESVGRLYILPAIGGRRLEAVTPIVWQSCVDLGAKAGLSRRSCTNIIQSITAFIAFARRNRWDVERLEKGDVKVPLSAPPKKPKRVLQPNDIRTLFAESTIIHYGKPTPAHYIHAWRFYVATGLRRGELAGLRNEDIVGSEMTVRRSINTHAEETRGKNDNARRTATLSAVALAILGDQRAMLAVRGMVSPWVFPDENGERPDPNSIYKRWKTYREQHGIASSIHELRHTFVSVNKADMPIELLKGLVGHSASMDTTGIYGHEIDGERERAAKIVDDVFARILGLNANENQNGL
jgi:integrase